MTSVGEAAQLRELKRKYREERDKRIDSSRMQSLDLVGDLARYRQDPHTQATSRDSVHDEVDVVIVGAGLGGLIAAARLRELGIERIRLVDAAGDVGGVWYWNRYPGAMCDVESYIYLPLLEELGYIPGKKYAYAAEIWEHTRSIARHYDLDDLALMHTSVTHLAWHEGDGRWVVETDRGDSFAAQYVVLALGTLSSPRLPAIPGLEDFRGTMFHTSRWNYTYTGGDAESSLSNLHDQKVAVVGTGATGLQVIPAVARDAQKLYVVQRTPTSVGPRNNRPTDQEFLSKLESGWQNRRRWNFSSIVEGGIVTEDLVNDGWTENYRNVLHEPRFSEMSPDEVQLALELVDVAKMESLRARVDEIVLDPITAESLKPYYAYNCKRPGFHDDYLAAYNRPNVELIDTQGRSIERVTETGFEVNGQFFEVDAIIFATGFDLGDNSANKLKFPILGRDGVDLAAKWRNGLTTLHGILVHGFPNIFVLPSVNSQSHGAVNWTHLLEESATYLSHVVRKVRDSNHTEFEVTAEAEAEWVETILKRKQDNLAFLEACTPGRANFEGAPAERFPQNTNYGGGFLELVRVQDQWRDDGMPGLETRLSRKHQRV